MNFLDTLYNILFEPKTTYDDINKKYGLIILFITSLIFSLEIVSSLGLNIHKSTQLFFIVLFIFLALFILFSLILSFLLELLKKSISVIELINYLGYSILPLILFPPLSTLPNTLGNFGTILSSIGKLFIIIWVLYLASGFLQYLTDYSKVKAVGIIILSGVILFLSILAFNLALISIGIVLIV